MDLLAFVMSPFGVVLVIFLLTLSAANSVVNWWQQRRRNRDWAPALRPSKKQREKARARRARGEEIL